jgi:hypothetical protein
MRAFLIGDSIAYGEPRTKFIIENYTMHPLDAQIFVGADDVNINLPNPDRLIGDCTFTIKVGAHQGLKIDDTPINQGVDSVIVQFKEGSFQMAFLKPKRVEGLQAVVSGILAGVTATKNQYKLLNDDFFHVYFLDNAAYPNDPVVGSAVTGGYALPGDLLKYIHDDPPFFELVSRAQKTKMIDVANVSKTLTKGECFPYDEVFVTCTADTANCVLTLPVPEEGNSIIHVNLLKKTAGRDFQIAAGAGITVDGVTAWTKSDLEQGETLIFKAISATEWILV